MKIQFSRTALIGALLALLATSPGLFAQVTPPGRIYYQGVLRDASGNPINGSLGMTFRFYGDAVGTLLWEETFGPGYSPPTVTVSGGLFTLALGDPAHRSAGSEALFADVFAGHVNIYLGVTVGADPEMTPRIQVISAPFALNAATLQGMYPSSFLNTSSTPQSKTGKLTLNSTADFGVDGSGPSAGGFFHGPLSGSAYAGYGNTGIDAYGSTTGGYFHGPLTGYAHVGYGNEGINAYGSASGGSFWNADGKSFAYAGAPGGDGLVGYGREAGGILTDLDTFSYTYVGYNTYKIQGTGTVSFVQNHPTDKDKVIVYAAPEGDEVATYTRGSAKLVNGEARVKLGATFKWVTNPDIGLTAHLTPHGEAVPLAVELLSTTELVVKGPKDGPADLVFDYLVYGLRIGFEESSIVQEKQRESFIPSFKDHRERYAKYPELRAYNSLERFKSMEHAAGLRASLDFSASRALHDAIHEYDPAADPPVEKLFGFSQGVNPSESAQAFTPSAGPTSPPPPATPTAALQKVAQAATESTGQTDATPAAQPPISTAAPRFPLSEPVEAGDVLVMDPHQEGRLMACHQAADVRLVGVAMEVSSEAVPVTVSGIVLVNVDANYAPVRQGDWLTTSPTPGHAMRTDSLVPGTIVGKALESLDSGTGLIQVLVMLR